ncbi:MAG TPA: hypothetical protein VFF86_09420, partial [Candidatus Methylomirabilis sp.]|nr:hypothetical protein [Candidatus Methylomirabilis sp.]
GTLWRRSQRIKFKFPLFTLIDREFPTYAPKDCPMCRKGIPINREYLFEPPPKNSRRRAAGAH